MVIFATVCYHGNSLQYTHMNENGISGVFLIFTVNARSLNPKLRQISYFQFVILFQVQILLKLQGATLIALLTFSESLTTILKHCIMFDTEKPSYASIRNRSFYVSWNEGRRLEETVFKYPLHSRNAYSTYQPFPSSLTPRSSYFRGSSRTSEVTSFSSTI